ncbi:hypothetical protein AWH56_008930 [Anaerobacillus isosaccharinicus]|uniref:LSM domain-containing protein n=1 Tax=Anaerobacillus isosaccharinicus TaxID=1532552 RepID=A0A1S2KY46_9BACI|nr:hypothetical protein [Anaerobacillus isosaccharinicus]QOY37685.1 hypothetical protein AWH56_008930 [Anaerobacillus isosaccharinicus]
MTTNISNTKEKYSLVDFLDKELRVTLNNGEVITRGLITLDDSKEVLLLKINGFPNIIDVPISMIDVFDIRQSKTSIFLFLQPNFLHVERDNDGQTKQTCLNYSFHI